VADNRSPIRHGLVRYLEMQVEFGPEEPVTLEVLGEDVHAPVTVRVVSVSRRTLTVEGPAEIAPGTAVRLHSPRYVLLCEVTDVVPHSGLLKLTIRHTFAAADVERIQQRWR
jgi:hypothetical protein